MIDLACISIAVGLVVSLTFSEYLGKAAGGLVVPGYLALSVTRPIDICLTLAAAAATYAIVHWASALLIIYGKRRTAAMILVGFAVGAAFRMLAGQLAAGTAELDHSGYTVIGFIIPGLIAIWCARQGLLDTGTSLLTATVIVRLVLILFATTQLELHEFELQPPAQSVVISQGELPAEESPR